MWLNKLRLLDLRLLVKTIINKNLKVFGSKFSFLVLTSLEKMQQNINSYISFVLAIINLKIILKKFLSLADLPRTQKFYYL